MRQRDILHFKFTHEQRLDAPIASRLHSGFIASDIATKYDPAELKFHTEPEPFCVSYWHIQFSEIDDNGFTAEVHFGTATKAYFQGFDKSKIAKGKSIELTDVVVVLGPTDTPFGRCLAIRKLTDEELAEAKKFAEAEAQPNVREWSDSAGKFKIKAEFIGVEGGTVTLKKDDGTEVKVPRVIP